MPRTITLAELRTDLRALTGFENVPDPSDTLLNRLLNDAITEVWDLLIQKWDDLYTTSTTVVVAAGDAVALPATFYKLRKLETQNGPKWVRNLPFDLDVSHTFSTVTGKRYRYRLQGANLQLSVPVAQSETFRIWYIPFSPRLSADGDLFDGINGYEQLVLQTARRTTLDRFELDTANAEKEIVRLTARIRTAADGRDASEPFYLNPHGPPDDEIDEWEG
jgi:hypothetical protein